MLAASQDIDNFIERQRSKLNKQPNRQSVNRPPPPQQQAPPPPPPPAAPPPPANLNDRLDFRVARILDEPPPRQQPQQPYYPPSPPPFTGGGPPFEQQTPFYPDQRRQSMGGGGAGDDNPAAFFERFGTYDEKRSQLKDDLKREYNEYLQSQRSVSKSKSTSQLVSPRGTNNNNRRVQFQQDGTVVAPWEKKDGKAAKNAQSMNDLSSTTTTTTNQFTSSNRSRPRGPSNQDEQYIRDREEYILELQAQIRELEARRKQLEIEAGMISNNGSSNVVRAHHAEDLSALNTLLAQRLSQRNAVDLELARILNRPPVSVSPTRIGSGGAVPSFDNSFDQSYAPAPDRNQNQRGRGGGGGGDRRNENRSVRSDEGFQIGRESDKDAEQATKKRYQQELQAQMRETQMRKAHAKQEKDEYERKLEAEIQNYNYFGRGGGGAPMRDKDGNVVANLADLRNPPQQQQQQQYTSPRSQQQQQQYPGLNDKMYSLGGGQSSITDSPFYNGDPQNPSTSARPSSPNHARGAVSNGIFGTAKTDAQRVQEEKYKLDLKRQIDEKRQRNADEVARRRAEDERELAKHKEWQEQAERQTAEDALRKQEKEAQDRENQQQLQADLERQKQQDESLMKRKAKRPEKPPTPRNDHNDYEQNPVDDHQEVTGPAYRSSSPPVPTLKNKGKKQKANNNNTRRPSFDDVAQQQPPPAMPLDNNDDFAPPPVDDADEHGRQTYRKPPTPRQQEPPTRKKPPQTYRARPGATTNTGMPMRTNSMSSLRSDGSDSEVLNRLEHLKRQLRDKEERLQKHVDHHKEAGLLSDIEERSTVAYRPPSQPIPRKQSPGFLLNAARVHHRDSPTTNDKLLRVLHADDDDEFKPSYFRDDSILMRGGGGAGNLEHDYIGPSKRVDFVDGMFVTNLEDAARRRRYGAEPPGFFDRENPTSMASLELNRIVEQNEQRLKKLRDLEGDDTSILDSNEVLERFQQKQRLQRRGSQTTLQDDAWLK